MAADFPIIYYSSEVELNNLIEQFENKSLPKEKWTHHAHITVGLYYSFHFPSQEALSKMRNGIISYNESIGTINNDSSGYHETITVFWMWSIRNFLTTIDTNQPIHAMANELLNNSCCNKSNVFQFYSNDLLFSKEARARFVPPDLTLMSKESFGELLRI